MKGRPSVVSPSSRTATRSEARSTFAEVVDDLGQAARRKSAPGRKPRRSSGTGHVGRRRDGPEQQGDERRAGTRRIFAHRAAFPLAYARSLVSVRCVATPREAPSTICIPSRADRCGGLERRRTHDLGRLLGGDGQRRAAVEVAGDVGVVAVPACRGRSSTVVLDDGPAGLAPGDVAGARAARRPVEVARPEGRLPGGRCRT